MSLAMFRRSAYDLSRSIYRVALIQESCSSGRSPRGAPSMNDPFSLDSCATQESVASRATGDRPADVAKEALFHEALDLWLRWNVEHDQATQELFGARRDAGKLAELLERMDQIAQLRWRAIELSQTLLERRA